MKKLLLLGCCAALSACISPQKIPPVKHLPDTQVFVWHDLASINPQRTRDFYGNLFGWDLLQLHSTYSLITKNETEIGGMIHAAKINPGQKNSVWLCTIRVKNLDATLKKITAHGGSILRQPEWIPDRGTQALFADPNGAVLVIVEPPIPAGPQTSTDWIWHELVTADAEDSANWYATVFELESEKSGQGNRFFLKSGDHRIASVSENPFEETRNQWIPVLAVTPFDRAVSKVVKYGGRVLIPPSEARNQGQLALILDPDNAPLILQKKGAGQ